MTSGKVENGEVKLRSVALRSASSLDLGVLAKPSSRFCQHAAHQKMSSFATPRDGILVLRVAKCVDLWIGLAPEDPTASATPSQGILVLGVAKRDVLRMWLFVD